MLRITGGSLRIRERADIAAEPHPKPRSYEVTDGMERAPARAMLRAVGMADEDFDKPQIAVASSWNEVTPCNLPLDRLAKRAKEGVRAAGGYPMEFTTIAVSDGISMGHEGMRASLVSREVIADSVELMVHAERLDGMVLLAGCDKSLPGMLMAAARMDLAACFLYGGTILPGRLGDKDLTILDAFEGVGACAIGRISREELDEIERHACPTEGSCAGMYTANTMAAASEALGMALIGSAVAAGGRPAPGGVRGAQRRGRAGAARRRHHRPQDPHQAGIRERDRRRDGGRRVHQRGAAPARDRERGPGRPDPGRLQPDRRPHPAPGRRQARSAGT